MTEKTNNQVTICGEIITDAVLVYEKDGEDFYEFLVKVEDEHEVRTICSVTLSKNLLKDVKICKRERIYVKGCLRSYCNRGNGAKLSLTVFAQNLFNRDSSDECGVMFTGTLCKPISLQTTDKGKTVARTLISIEREENCSDYIPLAADDYCLTELKSLAVGDKIAVLGVLKSVQHKEEISATEMYIRTDVADEVFLGGFVKV